MTREPSNAKLIADFLDGVREEQDYRRLESCFAADREALRAFVAQLLVEQDLGRLSLDDDVNRFIDAQPGVANPLEDRVDVEAKRRFLGWRSITLAAIAASLALVSLATLRMSMPDEPALTSDDPQNRQPQLLADANRPIVATLSELKDCQWGNDSEGYASGRHFAASSILHLASGVAQLNFETGAVLVMEGPSQLVVADNAVELTEGRISAVVPRSAHGFTVTTPNSEIIDLGTEFGVSFDDSGGTQVHVFSGEVVTRARDQQGKAFGEPMFVRTQDAIHFPPGTALAERFEANEEAFVRWLTQDDDSYVKATPPVDGNLLLWLREDSWVLDGQNGINLWRDTLSEFNSIADNALQSDPVARPRVVPNAIGGRPAVRFDGIDDCLITTPMTSGDSQTVVFVCAIRGSLYEFPQIINYNGPPQLQTEDKSRPGILQIMAMLDDRQQIRLRPLVYVGLIADEYVSVGSLDSQDHNVATTATPFVGEPFIAAYVYDHLTNHAELWINKQSVGTTTAPSPIALTSRKVIGRHGGRPFCFCGDLAELLIFDESLDQQRLDALCGSLAEKYQISVAR